MHYQSQFPVAATSRTSPPEHRTPAAPSSSSSSSCPHRFRIPACPPVTKIIYSTWCRGRRTPNFLRDEGRAGQPLPCGSLSVKLFKRKPLRMLTLSFTFYLFCHLINFLPGDVVPDLHTKPMESLDRGHGFRHRRLWIGEWGLGIGVRILRWTPRLSPVAGLWFPDPVFALWRRLANQSTEWNGAGGFSGASW